MRIGFTAGVEVASLHASQMAHSIATMIEVRAELVAERGEPTGESEMAMFVDEVARRTEIRLRTERLQPPPPLSATPLARPVTVRRALAPVAARPTPQPLPAGQPVLSIQPELPAPEPSPATETPRRPLTLDMDLFAGERTEDEAIADLTRLAADGFAIVIRSADHPMRVWEELERRGLAHLVDEVVRPSGRRSA